MPQESIARTFQRINNSTWINWTFRIVFTLEFIHTALVKQESIYPDHCWLMILISIWLYFSNQRIAGIIPLIFSFLIHYWHVPVVN